VPKRESNMNIKEVVTDIKTWIFVIGLIIAITMWTNKYHKLPDDVQSNTKNIGQLTDNVKEYVHAQQTYVEVNEEWKKAQQVQQELMLEIIKDK
jgi:hypothetical protein